MMQGKACRTCRKVIEEGSKCPVCHGETFTTFWRGFVVFVKPEQSEIAKKMAIESTGKFALRLSR